MTRFDPAPFRDRPGVEALLAALKEDEGGVRFVGGAVNGRRFACDGGSLRKNRF